MAAGDARIGDMLRVIDRYAFSNRLRNVDPAQKSGIALATILLCLLLDRPLVGWIATVWMVGIMAGYARIPLHVVIAVLTTESVFLVLSVVGIAVSVGFEASEAALRLGPLWIGFHHAALPLALQVFSRALGCTAALNFLVLTTPLVDLIELMHRLRVPALLVEVMMLSYRAIFVLLDTLEQMVTAQTARLGYTSWQSTLRSSALIGSRLFVIAYQRSQALEQALIGRGFDGDVRVLPLSYRTEQTLWLIGILIFVSLFLARWWS
ncbi:MAG TPA: cobalt ECF transporter T component CbiQ [Chloroflexus aurantiacus]|jgi:cobalt/nickel transport system permease protein|uniref:Cobalt ABC transporter, inner membrane subunit CbiQ n=1 Tax=Chloroflexus aurantiacus (strain ATCC 29366 / DSM 635 / J-10-fl) TaxID=324602 RepID=A9WIQ4_CHLAA|nr:cobalt ECF transporter T component CbiQ [Chloroflexus aurantiacus]ABY35781.1 cobalt ABC transporter, inner membrane subunit CbiQ [Chloroflexus aurantiacus J-10-fl]RMG48183.1 MAG: cobalt ECF transporter T component CbiQ [Chloroflexota bacterium]HBW66697.1 cobalt ECF transporter T component CbiQ [Chloroflexus aurantiacus]